MARRGSWGALILLLVQRNKYGVRSSTVANDRFSSVVVGRLLKIKLLHLSKDAALKGAENDLPLRSDVLKAKLLGLCFLILRSLPPCLCSLPEFEGKLR